MLGRIVIEAARIIVDDLGTHLEDSPLTSDELIGLNESIDGYGLEAIGELPQERAEHIRLKDPENKGYHRDFAVRWGPGMI
jgi:hypothetical protein